MIDESRLNEVSLRAVRTIARVLPLFGTKWLARLEPTEANQKRQLLALGMCYLTDIVAAEAARQIGFLRACYGITEDRTFPITQPNWPEVGSQVAIDLLPHVVRDWRISAHDERTESAGPEAAEF
jgi:hypothetical protein